MTTGYIYVALRADLHNEFVLRSGKSVDVGIFIEDLVTDFLDRTKLNDIWSEQYLEQALEEDADATTSLNAIGPPNKGYQWQNVFLPNGTTLRMNYRRQEHIAEVRHQQIVYRGQSVSPSQFARLVANNTSRNAWHDIWIRLPGQSEWVFSDELRRGRQ